jgi:thioredoxin 2
VPGDRLGETPQCGRCGETLLDGRPHELDDARLPAVLSNTELPVVIDFWAPWCGPCRAMAPQFEQAAHELRGRALLIKVNSDDNPEASARYGIRSIPTLIKLQSGREVARSSGAQPAASIVRFAS